MKKIVAVIVALVCAISLQAQGDLHLFSVDNKSGKVTPEIIEKALIQNGFTLAVNSPMNGPFQKQFQQTDFLVFNLLVVYHTALTQDLLKKYPDAGIFTPMSIGIYQAKNEDTLHISFLTSQAQEKILGLEDMSILQDIEKKVVDTLVALFPDAKQALSEDSFKESRNLVTKYELDLDGEDWYDAYDSLGMNLEAGFNPYGFIIAALADMNDNMTKGDTVASGFDFYDTYSICKLKVIYTVAKSRPEASGFAPCTTIVYKKTDEDKIVIAFPAVYNWMSSAKVEDKEAKKVLMKAQNDFESVLKEITE